MERFYTPDYLAKLLGCSYRRVLHLIEEGRIRAVNIGSGKRPSWRIYDGELQRFMAECYETQITKPSF